MLPGAIASSSKKENTPHLHSRDMDKGICLKIYAGKGKAELEPNWPTLPELIPVSVAQIQLGVLLLPLDGMLVHRRLPPSILSLVPIYTPGERETQALLSVFPKNTTQ